MKIIGIHRALDMKNKGVVGCTNVGRRRDAEEGEMRVKKGLLLVVANVVRNEHLV